MARCFNFFRPWMSVGLGLAVTVPLYAQLAAKSPFMPPQSGGAGTPTAGAPLEFRGFIETSEGVQYRIYDPAKKSGIWVKLNEKNPDFDVLAKQHDNGQKTLIIEHQGKTLTLAERESKVVSSGSAAAAMPPPVAVPPVQTNVPAAVTQAVVLNPTPADEQRRLDAVAAEVARRRALREQATQQMTQGAAQVVPQPLPQAVPQVQVQQPLQGNYPPQNSPNVQQRTRGPQPQPANTRQR
jgi:hypothetical protein